MDHFNVYETRCRDANIAPHEAAIPKEEKDRRDGAEYVVFFS